jgi:hypothetical protein
LQTKDRMLTIPTHRPVPAVNIRIEIAAPEPKADLEATKARFLIRPYSPSAIPRTTYRALDL